VHVSQRSLTAAQPHPQIHDFRGFQRGGLPGTRFAGLAQYESELDPGFASVSQVNALFPPARGVPMMTQSNPFALRFASHAVLHQPPAQRTRGTLEPAMSRKEGSW